MSIGPRRASRRAPDTRATGPKSDADRGGRRRFTSRGGIGSPALLLFLPVLLITLGAAPATAGPAVVQVRSTASVVISDAGGTLNTVESVTLAKGSWTVTSNATAVNFGPGDFVRCHLAANGTTIDGGATTYLADRVGGLVNAGTWKSGSSFTVALLCDHDRDASSTGQFYFDAGVTLTAVQGGPIKSPTVTSSAPPKVVESRTTSAVSLPDNQGLAVTSVTLPQGRWAAIANVSAVDFTGFDWAACTLGATGGSYTSSSPFVGVGVSDGWVSGVTVEATVVIGAAGGSVTLVCHSDFGNDVYLDPGATLTANLVPNAANLVTHPIGLVALPDAAGAGTDVVSQHMAAGAWRITTQVISGLRNPNNSYGGGSDFVRCHLWANSTSIDGGATVLVSTNSNIQEIVDAGTFTSNAGWTLRLSCSHDTGISTGQHWTILDGMAQAIRKGPIA